MDFFINIWNFIVANWQTIALVALVMQNIIKGLRDALDTTPETDDNFFEKIATVSSKLLAYLIGFRPKAIGK